MQRYEEFAELINTPEGKRRISTLYYPSIEKRTSDIYIITKSTDRLDLLSFQYYNDTRYWVIIAKANNLHIPSFRVPAGIRLRIPFPLTHDLVQEQFINKNNV